jgi:CDP-diacylglycerol---glycerol-3-phosphate 3-phosphatidyltransferase
VAKSVDFASTISCVEGTPAREQVRTGPTGIATDVPVLGAITCCGHRECAAAGTERLATVPTAITAVRTSATVVLALLGAWHASLPLLLAALATYWIGDMADGAAARWLDCETRVGATLDILSDRISAALFYAGFAWYDPSMTVPVGIYLVEFMVVDLYLSLAFLAWPASSPNYFHLIDRRLWLWNWSKTGKALNSALFAVLLVWTRNPWLCGVVATALLVVKGVSLSWLLRLGLPVPAGCLHGHPNSADA